MSSTSSKKTYHHGDLRQELLTSAVRILREEGEAGLSMRKLATAVGVSRTAPYHHFADKRALLCGIAEEGFRRYRTVINADAPPTNATVRQFAEDYLAFATTQTAYYDLMFGSQLWRDEEVTDSLRELGHRCFRDYVEQIRRWQGEGAINLDLDPLRYSQVTWSTLHGMSRLVIDGIYLDSESIDAMTTDAAAMFWARLQP